VKTNDDFQSSDIVLNFPLAFGWLGKELGLILPGEEAICFDCARQLSETPYTRTTGAFWMPVLKCDDPPERAYISQLLASRLTSGQVMPQTTRFLLATIMRMPQDRPVLNELAQQFLKFRTTNNMAETGQAMPMDRAIPEILTMRSPTPEFPFGALYRQPLAAVQTIIELSERFELDGRLLDSAPVLQTAFVYTVMSAWLQLMVNDPTNKRDTLLRHVYAALYDYSSGTAVFESGRIMTERDAHDIVKLLFEHASPQGVVIDPVQLTVIFTCLLSLKQHQKLAGAVDLFRRHPIVGPFMIEALDNVKLLHLKNRDAEIRTMLNRFLFKGCHIVECADVPTLGMKYHC
jgi:hypothetical protein